MTNQVVTDVLAWKEISEIEFNELVLSNRDPIMLSLHNHLLDQEYMITQKTKTRLKHDCRNDKFYIEVK